MLLGPRYFRRQTKRGSRGSRRNRLRGIPAQIAELRPDLELPGVPGAVQRAARVHVRPAGQRRLPGDPGHLVAGRRVRASACAPGPGLARPGPDCPARSARDPRGRADQPGRVRLYRGPAEQRHGPGSEPGADGRHQPGSGQPGLGVPSGREAQGRHRAVQAGARGSRADRRARSPGHDRRPGQPGLHLPQRRAVARGDPRIRAHARRPGAAAGTRSPGHPHRARATWPPPTSRPTGSARRSSSTSAHWPTASAWSAPETWRR